MPEIDSGGVSIHYEDTGGAGPAVVLVHGYAANLELNWRWSGWFDALTASGRRVIALDCRGHGRSGKPHDPAAYGDGVMTDDVIAVLDAAGVDKADLLGYSMGGTIALGAVLRYAEHLRSVVFGGFGLHDPATVDGERYALADALTTPDPATVPDQSFAAFRKFLEDTGQDLQALAAAMRGQSLNEDEDAIKKVALPALVVCGEQDEALEGARRFARLLQRSQLVTVPGADHMSAVADPVFRDAVLAFLGSQSPVTD